MDPLTNPVYLAFAAIAPLLIALIKQAGFPQQANALIAFAAYILVGIGAAVVSGTPITLENVVPLITIATVVGTAAYNLVWSNLGKTTATDPGLDAKLTAATSVVKAA
jgi:hypothetical protein